MSLEIYTETSHYRNEDGISSLVDILQLFKKNFIVTLLFVFIIFSIMAFD